MEKQLVVKGVGMELNEVWRSLDLVVSFKFRVDDVSRILLAGNRS